MLAFFANYPLLSALASIVLAQVIKVPLYWFTNKKWDLLRSISTGGMPSSHSAGVSALATAVGISDGFSSSVFAVAAMVSVITMYDAAGIRRHAGIHAKLLNRILKSQSARASDKRDPVVLKEMLGHRPIEVVTGAIFGGIVSILLHLLI
ncbi:divergent PAP2 family protein [Cohnella candidum]|uniref:Divergent PAP2 family protein n=1 Tax=Cohnella candidum TaxID=2674991 RepID=A0A3G3JW21_9BACL|nr:divergent PAP2 family protein [Cohnella candidum]AYQ72432.1 divergent PAP2 family protein [Cohnella candidum]